METTEVETFWPPGSAEARRSWRRRQGAVSGAFVLVGAGIASAIVTAYELSRGKFDLVEHVAELALPGAGVLVLLAYMYFVVPFLTSWGQTKGTRKTHEYMKELLDPGEPIAVMVLGRFEGASEWPRSSHLIVTDRRLVRVDGTFSGVSWIEVAQRTDARAELTQRRANRNPLLRLYHQVQRTERCLTLAGADGIEHRFITDAERLDPLCDRLGAEGIEVGHRNDEDLPESAQAGPELRAVTIPAVRRGNIALVLVMVACLAVLALRPEDRTTALPFTPSAPGIPTRVVQYSARTTVANVLPIGRGAPLPKGVRQVLLEVRVRAAPVRTGPGGTSFALQTYQLLRIGSQAILRYRPFLPGRPAPATEAWILIGAPGDGDEAVKQAVLQMLLKGDPAGADVDAF